MSLLPRRIATGLMHSLFTLHRGPLSLTCRLFSIAFLLAAGAARAADYVVQATVTDIDARPLAGVQVAVGAIKKQPFKTSLQDDATGTTDASGQVTVKLSTSASPVGAAVIGEDPGRVHLPADPITRLSKGTNRIDFQLLSPPDNRKMAAGGTAESRGYFGDTGKQTYPPLETKSFTLDDSPLHLWRAYGTSARAPVLLVQGVFLTDDHPTPMQVFEQAFDLVQGKQGLRHAGRDVWVLAFSDPLAPVAAQAAAVSDAVRTASEEAGGAKVDVVGLSTGGLAARYALARDEATGGPSNGKVGVFATVDTPHQGANIHVGVQAALWAASSNSAGRILGAPGVQNMLYQWVGSTNFDQNDCRFPLNRTIQTATAAHDAFYAELAALNGDGYPHKSRNIAVAAAGPEARAWKVGDVIYRLKASLSIITLCSEEYKARAEDVLPGSTFPSGLLPDSYDAGAARIDLETRFNPTFIPLASALDLRGTATPFAATFAAAKGQLVHGAFPEGSVEFLMKELTGSRP
jgi:hypothetical protein